MNIKLNPKASVIDLCLCIILFLIPFVSSEVICNSNSFTASYNQGAIPTVPIVIATNCHNQDNNSVIGNPLGSFFNLLDGDSISNQIVLGPNSTRGGIRILLANNLSATNYAGFISFNDGSFINILVSINPSQQPNPSDCNINPSLISYTQTVQQGTEFELPKITFNPTNCQGPLAIGSPFISGGITTPEGQKPVYIKSAGPTEILLGVNTKGLSSLTYNSKLTLTSFGKTFQDILLVSIIVTGGTNPQGQFNSDNLPTCSISSSILNLNSTYSLICTNLIPDLKIIPIIDPEYIRGTDTMLSSNQFIWDFTPKKYGNTFIMVEFRYLDSPVGDLFKQEVKISPQGSIVPGTDLYLDFIPRLNQLKIGEETIIQILDNKSRSLVDRSELYIDSIFFENVTGKSFKYKFLPNKNYTLRAISPGYNDLIQIISLKPIIPPLFITPSFGDTNTIFVINSSVEGISLFINSINVPFPYIGNLREGVNNIVGLKEDFEKVEINITIIRGVEISTSGEFKRGVHQTIYLGKIVNWTIFYGEESTSINSLEIKGYSDKIEFDPNKDGFYKLEADGQIRIFESKELRGMWFGYKWYWYVVALVIIVLLFVYIRSKSDQGYSTGPSLSGTVRTS